MGKKSKEKLDPASTQRKEKKDAKEAALDCTSFNSRQERLVKEITPDTATPNPEVAKIKKKKKGKKEGDHCEQSSATCDSPYFKDNKIKNKIKYDCCISGHLPDSEERCKDKKKQKRKKADKEISLDNTCAYILKKTRTDEDEESQAEHTEKGVDVGANKTKKKLKIQNETVSEELVFRTCKTEQVKVHGQDSKLETKSETNENFGACDSYVDDLITVASSKKKSKKNQADIYQYNDGRKLVSNDNLNIRNCSSHTDGPNQSKKKHKKAKTDVSHQNGESKLVLIIDSVDVEGCFSHADGSTQNKKKIKGKNAHISEKDNKMNDSHLDECVIMKQSGGKRKKATLCEQSEIEMLTSSKRAKAAICELNENEMLTNKSKRAKAAICEQSENEMLTNKSKRAKTAICEQSENEMLTSSKRKRKKTSICEQSENEILTNKSKRTKAAICQQSDEYEVLTSSNTKFTDKTRVSSKQDTPQILSSLEGLKKSEENKKGKHESRSSLSNEANEEKKGKRKKHKKDTTKDKIEEINQSGVDMIEDNDKETKNSKIKGIKKKSKHNKNNHNVEDMIQGKIDSIRHSEEEVENHVSVLKDAKLENLKKSKNGKEKIATTPTEIALENVTKKSKKHKSNKEEDKSPVNSAQRDLTVSDKETRSFVNNISECELQNASHASNGNADDIQIPSDRTETAKPAALGQWNVSMFESSERQNKFLKLLGGFKKCGEGGNVPKKGLFGSLTLTQSVIKKVGGQTALSFEQAKEFDQRLAMDYENARAYCIGNQQGKGLGFKPDPAEGKKFYIDVNKTASKKFED